MDDYVRDMEPSPDKVRLEQQLRQRSILRSAYVFAESNFIQNLTNNYPATLTNYEMLKHIAEKLYSVETCMMDTIFHKYELDYGLMTIMDDVNEYRERWNKFKESYGECVRDAIRLLKID